MAEKKKLLELIDKEIAWHRAAGGMGPNRDYQDGFIAGLKQAKFLIGKILALIGE